MEKGKRDAGTHGHLSGKPMYSMPRPESTDRSSATMKAKLLESQTSEALRPDISYKQALSSRFTLDQNTYTIGDCPSEAFKRFIKACYEQASDKGRRWNPTQQGTLLHMLDTDCSDVARWYTIDTLLEQKVRVPLERGKGRSARRTP